MDFSSLFRLASIGLHEEKKPAKNDFHHEEKRRAQVLNPSGCNFLFEILINFIFHRDFGFKLFDPSHVHPFSHIVQFSFFACASSDFSNSFVELEVRLNTF